MKFFNLFEIEKKVELLDIGASIIEDSNNPDLNNLPTFYDRIVELNYANLHAFDGDPRQQKRILEKYKSNIYFYNDFIFDGTNQKLYVTGEKSGMTSLFKPNTKVLNFFNGFEKFGKVLETKDVQTKKLDDIKNLPSIDFVKMDIQGAELTVLKNAQNKLKNCIAIQLETPFVCLYENQPSNGEIDIWLRSKGFMPHSYVDIKRWSIKPTIFGNNLRIPGNQLLESDILYIKDPFKIDLFDVNQIKKLIVISHYCYKSFDLACYLIIELEKRKELPSDSHKDYIVNARKYN